MTMLVMSKLCPFMISITFSIALGGTVTRCPGTPCVVDSPAMKYQGICVLWTLALAACTGGGDGTEPADLVLRNGKIVTVDASMPEAQALAARGDRIIALGTDEEIEAYIGDDTRVIDLDGQLAAAGKASRIPQASAITVNFSEISDLVRMITPSCWGIAYQPTFPG